MLIALPEEQSGRRECAVAAQAAWISARLGWAQRSHAARGLRAKSLKLRYCTGLHGNFGALAEY